QRTGGCCGHGEFSESSCSRKPAGPKARAFRPNPIGMSLVELKEVVCHKDSVILKLGSQKTCDAAEFDGERLLLRESGGAQTGEAYST
ncbi:hypothetical protein O5833_27935, partial [Escherichia coli]|nr:hypothetical protein [Escherichia coli]